MSSVTIVHQRIGIVRIPWKALIAMWHGLCANIILVKNSEHLPWVPEIFLARFPVTAEDVSAFSQHRKFPLHARKTSGTQDTEHCDCCGIWRWICRPDCSSISFFFFFSLLNRSCTKTSLINIITDHESEDIFCCCSMESRSLYRFHLWTCESVTGVKVLQTRKKSTDGFENLLLQGLASHSEGKLCCCCCCWCYIISATYRRIIISLNL